MGKVGEWIRAVAKWLHIKGKYLTIGVVIMVVLVIGFFGWLTFVFFVGDDLILQVEINQTSFRITNVEDATAHITLSTKNQMFCTAQCSFSVLNVSTNTVVSKKNYTINRGQRIEEIVNITPRRLGEGQVIYSVTASCHNIRSTLCPTLSPQRAKTVLLTVNYGLAPSEAQLKKFLKPHVEGLLELSRQTDLMILSSKYLLTENPALRPGTLLANLTTVEEEYAAHTVTLEEAKLLWTQELYGDLYTLTANRTEGLNQTLREAVALNDALFELPDKNNKLLHDVDTARSNVNDLLTTFSYLATDPVVSPLHVALVNETNQLIMVSSLQLYQSYPELQLRIMNLQNNTRIVDRLFQNRTLVIIQEGALLVTALNNSLCATQPGCSNQSGYVSLSMSDLCTELGNLSQSAQILNVSVSLGTTLFRSTYCSLPQKLQINTTVLEPLALVIPGVIESTVNVTLPDNLPLCCVFGECRACCISGSCRSDPSTFPVVFVHGHAFNGGNSPEYSLGGYFIKIQHELQGDGYLDAGIITPSSLLSEVEEGEWGLSGKPVTARVTYYYNFYRDGTAYTVITQKSESIETYAIRLKESIDLVKHHTGKEKVNIVAHSMGGLVVRRYMQLFGDASVNTVVFIATPHQGIGSSTLRLCPLLGETKECSDMAKDSVFMRKLNDPDAQPQHARLVTITGKGCTMGTLDGDGVVEAQNAYLPGAKNYDIHGSCSDFFNSELHTEILNVEEYPQVYEIIKDELK